MSMVVMVIRQVGCPVVAPMRVEKWNEMHVYAVETGRARTAQQITLALIDEFRMGGGL